MTESAEAVVRAGSSHAGPSQPSHRCVLLSPPDGDPPDALLRGLRARSVDVVAAADGPQVMVALAERNCDICILCGDVDALARSALVDAICAYHPKLALWSYGPAAESSSSELRRLPIERTTAHASAVKASKPASPSAAPATDSRSHADAPSALRPRAAQQEDEPLLTSEELQMLLADDWDSGEEAMDDPDNLSDDAAAREAADEAESWEGTP